MMKEWQALQEIYHRLNNDADFRDDLNKVDIVITEDVVADAVRHFYQRVDEWIYPSKSYFVAICYAYWIHHDFGDDFYETLNDPMLLYCNDPYFVPYSSDEDTYDQIIKHLDISSNINAKLPQVGMVPDVKEYYEEEIGYGIR